MFAAILLPKPATLIFLFFVTTTTKATTTTARRSPPLGWQNWNYWHNNINASIFMETADFLISSGLRDAGYALVSLGGIGYAATTTTSADDNDGKTITTIVRNSTGYLQASEQRFGGNVGMARLSSYLHSRQFQFGSYTEAGTAGCNGWKGSSEGFERQDAELFFDEWKSDYLMVDSCGIVPHNGRSPAEQAKYELTLWRALINNYTTSGSREILLHNCHNGCASTFSGPTLEAKPCDDDLSRDDQLWYMSLDDGDGSPLMNSKSGQCVGCAGEPMGGCGGSSIVGGGHLKHGFGMQACIGCRTMWNASNNYSCDATGLGEARQVFNFSKESGLIRQKLHGSCLSVSPPNNNGRSEIITLGGPFEPPCNDSSKWDAETVSPFLVKFRSRTNQSLCLAQGKVVESTIDPWCQKNNNMWRSSTDTLQNWGRIMMQVESMALQGNISKPNSWAFPDCLEVGVPGKGTLTWEETKSNVALYAITSSPLFLGNDARSGRMQRRLVDLLLNPDMLYINQYVSENNNKKFFAGGRLKSYYTKNNGGGAIEIWGKPLLVASSTKKSKNNNQQQRFTATIQNNTTTATQSSYTKTTAPAVAIVLFNRGGYVPSCTIDYDRPDLAPCDDDSENSYGAQSITLDFAKDIPREWIITPASIGSNANINNIDCDIIDIFGNSNNPSKSKKVGRITGSYTTQKNVPPHGVSFLRIENCGYTSSSLSSDGEESSLQQK